MNTRTSLAAFAVAVTAAFTASAQAEDGALTREEVVKAVLAARSVGTLTPAGPAVEGLVMRSRPTSSQTSRAEVEQGYSAARAAGSIQAAGDGSDGTPVAAPSATGFTRESVVSETLKAIAAKKLVPSGEDVGGVQQTRVI